MDAKCTSKTHLLKGYYFLSHFGSIYLQSSKKWYKGKQYFLVIRVPKYAEVEVDLNSIKKNAIKFTKKGKSKTF